MLVAETCRSLNSLVRNVPKRLGNLTEEVRGRISIQVISSLVCERFDAAISRFHDHHPKVEILIGITTWDSVAAALLRDEIEYAPPFGLLGRWLGERLIRRRLERMFEYRHETTRRLIESGEWTKAAPQ